MPPHPHQPAELKEACVAEARQIIAEFGVEKLSLREVSRRLGVSHQAPYRHFPTRDHILAEVVARAYADFAAALVSTKPSGDPFERLRRLGVAYLDYARSHPLNYRLMFGTPLPRPADHPAMLRQANYAFGLLRDHLDALPAGLAAQADGKFLEVEAVFVWSTLHGLASAMQADAMKTIDLGRDVTEIERLVLDRLGAAIGSRY